MPHGCNDDELPWGKSSKADPLDTKVNFVRLVLAFIVWPENEKNDLCSTSL